MEAGSVSTIQEAWGDFVDPREHLYDDAAWIPLGGGYATGRVEDRDRGQDRTLFSVEADLDYIRAQSRLCATTDIGVNVLETLSNYVIGSGLTYECQPERAFGDRAAARDAQRVIDEFLDRHDWRGDYEAEAFRRTIRDGEWFPTLFASDGYVDLRTTEPEQCREPAGLPHYGRCATFGVETDADDLERVFGYWLQVDPFGGQLEFFDATEVLHVKRNVDRKVKRGVSDFWPIRRRLIGSEKLLDNATEGAAVQAGIAYVVTHPSGTKASDVQSLQNSTATMSRMETDQRGITRNIYGQRAGRPKALHVPKGQEYEGSPLANGEAARAFVEVHAAAMRSIGARWQMPEYLISGDASNANYASSMVAESPFVKRCETQQAWFGRQFARILWRVLRVACDRGRVGVDYETLKRCIDLKITGPQVAVRNRVEETTRREVLSRAGVLSLRTWAQQEDLDYDAEQAAGAKPQAAATFVDPLPTQSPEPAAKPQEQPAADSSVADTALNGAQIASLLAVTTQVSDGTLTKPAAIDILSAAFPAMDAQRISAIVGKIEVKPPQGELPPPPPPTAEQRIAAATRLLWEGYP